MKSEFPTQATASELGIFSLLGELSIAPSFTPHPESQKTSKVGVFFFSFRGALKVNTQLTFSLSKLHMRSGQLGTRLKSRVNAYSRTLSQPTGWMNSED